MAYNTQITAYFMQKSLLIRDAQIGENVTTSLYQKFIVNTRTSALKNSSPLFLFSNSFYRKQNINKILSQALPHAAETKHEQYFTKFCGQREPEIFQQMASLQGRPFVTTFLCKQRHVRPSFCKAVQSCANPKRCKNFVTPFGMQNFVLQRVLQTQRGMQSFAVQSFASPFGGRLRRAKTTLFCTATHSFAQLCTPNLCTKLKKNNMLSLRRVRSSTKTKLSLLSWRLRCTTFKQRTVRCDKLSLQRKQPLLFGGGMSLQNIILHGGKYKTNLYKGKVSLLSQQTSSNCTGIDDKITRTIVITSGKGGVGKTTTTANLGMSIARLGYRVTLIDADIGLRNLDLLLGLENRVLYTAMDIFEGDCRLDQALIRDKRLKNLCLLAISKNRQRYNVTRQKMDSLISSICALGSDFILIDCPAGIDIGFINAISPAQEALIITTPEITAMRDADRVAGLLEANGIYNAKLLINRVRPDMIQRHDMMSVQDVQDVLGIPLLGAIPEDLNVIISTNRGEPLVLSKKLSLSGVAFENAARRLVGKQEYLIDLKSPYKNIFHKMKALLFNT